MLLYITKTTYTYCMLWIPKKQKHRRSNPIHDIHQSNLFWVDGMRVIHSYFFFNFSFSVFLWNDRTIFFISLINRKTIRCIRKRISKCNNSIQERSNSGDRRWTAPWWRITYSVQYTALSTGLSSWSRLAAEIAEAFSWYL